ncbi:hypothetical protein FGG08_006784 [Glutinoglossum americanum]|uniref:Uncharacterized protein n=1 Tax=Glutinoglossum americanum TaxID=1670608 RepID=A0A9P8HVK5_9PEZI|nr:hypothetical protein FGG08_006784 [Glutinoglossum americanum]
MPEASTAGSGHNGLLCLRAVTTAVLCFYTMDTTTKILAKALPSTLICSDLEEGTIAIEGPIFAALRQFVEAVNVEEEVDPLRRQLVDSVVKQKGLVTGVPMSSLTMLDQIEDFGNIVGLLRWLLTPITKRTVSKYPTCSLKTWSLALVLSHLGFEIFAVLHAIVDNEEYKREFRDRNTEGWLDFPSVYLVCTGGCDVDPYRYAGDIVSAVPQPRFTPIRNIPRIVFAEHQGAEIQFLLSLFEAAYHGAQDLRDPEDWLRENISGCHILHSIIAQAVRILALIDYGTDATLRPKFAGEDIGNSQEDNLALFISFLCSLGEDRDVRKGAPEVGTQGCSKIALDLLTQDLRSLEKGLENIHPYDLFRAVILGITYSVFGSFVIYQNGRRGLDIDIAYFNHSQQRNSSFEMIQIKQLLSQSGVLTTPLGASQSIINFKAARERRARFCEAVGLALTGAMPKGSYTGKDHIWDCRIGVYANGVTVLPSIFIDPYATDLLLYDSYLAFHGRPLTLPITPNGEILSRSEDDSSIRSPPHIIPVNGKTRVSAIELCQTDTKVRLDFDVDWENNESAVVGRIRSGGLLEASVDYRELSNESFRYLWSAYDSRACRHQCHCGAPKHKSSFSRRWRPLTMSELLSFKTQELRLVGSVMDFWLVIQAKGDEPSQFWATYCLFKFVLTLAPPSVGMAGSTSSRAQLYFVECITCFGEDGLGDKGFCILIAV